MSGPIKFVISGTKNSNSTKHKSSVWVEHASKLLWLLCRAVSAQSTLSVANNLGPDFLVLFFSGSCSLALKLSFFENLVLILHYIFVNWSCKDFELHGCFWTQKPCFSTYNSSTSKVKTHPYSLNFIIQIALMNQKMIEKKVAKSWADIWKNSWEGGKMTIKIYKYIIGNWYANFM